jgi:hypothetical protein
MEKVIKHNKKKENGENTMDVRELLSKGVIRYVYRRERV